MLATFSAYTVVLFVHITAVVIAFGATFAYPLLDAYARRTGIADLVALHRFQIFLSRRLITPAMTVVLLAGLYLASQKPWKFSDPWIGAGIAIIVVIFGIVGAVLSPAERKMLEIAQRGERAGGGLGAEYDGVARRYAQLGSLVSLLVVVAIFVMVTKPGA